MKKVIMMLATALTTLSAAAQNQKLNFEAPLFGVTHKNVKPAWSVVALSSVEIGASYAFDVPDAMTPLGYYAEATLLELQARPWRNGNLFSVGVTLSTDRHYLKKNQFAFGDDGSMVQLPPMVNCSSEWFLETETYTTQNHNGVNGSKRRMTDLRKSVVRNLLFPGVLTFDSCTAKIIEAATYNEILCNF